MGSMDGKVCLVTGALGAIGTPICAALAREGATVVLGVRDEARGRAAADELKKTSGNPNIDVVVGDMASLASVRSMADAMNVRYPKLHVLVNNAAIFAGTRKTTTDGFEAMFGTNFLGPFLLTNLLLDSLRAGAPSRVVWLTMDNKGPLKLDDLQSERSFDKVATLSHSKAACGATSRELAKRLMGTGVTSNCVYPDITKTTLIREAPWWLRAVFAVVGQSPEVGAAGPLFLATAPELEGVTGRMYARKDQATFPPACLDDAGGARLWDASAKLVGLA
jgi:NAD(P)-dependent dehydrogenase (short-subunit alcohol dehydrogenase family)